ncbi:hypothetical protein FDP41_008370 [Naegleria fowleri]|uniref:Uncharacterized protein n=1 Tax=Naegleria fowleri TaxID=5763 RepID=A0A6A5B1I7_NAEFO|nr:uncharacterized protein FDP41_008370 [Naegleria fowleri]KAF0973163.1 hypothetical protein FDP41_008370 [Naegleria fowleri]CAG4714455.1 unnamed protein product [Naegleria fowleri]
MSQSQSLKATSNPSAAALKSVLLNFLQYYHCGNPECKYYHEEQPLDRPLLEQKLDSGEGICLKCFSCEERLYPCECCSQLFGGVHSNMNNHHSPHDDDERKDMIKFCSFCSFPNVANNEWRKRLSTLMCSEQDCMESMKFVQMQLVELSMIMEEQPHEGVIPSSSLTEVQQSSVTSSSSCEKEYFKHLEGLFAPNDNKLLGELFYATPISISAALKKSIVILTEPKAIFTEADFKMLNSLYRNDGKDEIEDSHVKTLLLNIETFFIKNGVLHSLLENIKMYLLSSVNFSLIPNCSRHGVIKSIFNNQFMLMMESLQQEFHLNLYPKILKPLNDHFATLTRSHMQHSRNNFNFPQNNRDQQGKSMPSFFVYPFTEQASIPHSSKDTTILFEKRFKLWRQLYFHLCYINHVLSLSPFY